MSTLFKIILYLGVLASLAGFALPYFADEPWMQSNPLLEAAGSVDTAKMWLAFGGLGLIIIGLIGRSATRKEEVEWK